MKRIIAILSILVVTGCSKNENTLVESEDTVKAVTTAATSATVQQTYLALGDSYTIGESVTQQQSFPFQLVAKLNSKGKHFATPKVIARTGWTTADLQKGITAANVKKKYDFVSLAIGVNNQYQGLSKSTYRTQFRALLSQAITFANGKASHVSVISIPDWGQTPYGKKSGRNLKSVSSEIDAFNAINKAECQARGASYTNITPSSRTVSKDPKLVASDGLHYSAKMYAVWGDAIITSYNRDN